MKINYESNNYNVLVILFNYGLFYFMITLGISCPITIYCRDFS